MDLNRETDAERCYNVQAWTDATQRGAMRYATTEFGWRRSALETFAEGREARAPQPSIYLSVCLSVCLSFYLSIYLSIYLPLYAYMPNRIPLASPQDIIGEPDRGPCEAQTYARCG